MSVDREYRIKVYTEASGSGAQQTAQDLEDVGKAGEQAGEGMKLFETHGREFHRLLHLLDEILPGTGLLLKAAFNPATLGIGALVLGIEAVKSAIESYNKKLEEAGEAAAKADFASGIEAAIEVYRTAAEEQQKYIDNLHEIERGEHGITSELNNQLQLIAAIAASRQAQAEAEKTLALAKLKEQEVFGQITPSQAIIERGRIEEQYTRDKRAAEEKKFQDEQTSRQQAASDAGNKQAELNKRQAESSEALAKAQAKQKRDIKDAPADEDIKKAQDEVDKSQQKLGDMQVEIGDLDSPFFKKRIKDAEDEAAAIQTGLQKLEKLKQQAKAANGTDLTPLEIAAEKAKQEAKENAKAEAAARHAANQAQAEHDQTAGSRDAADSASVRTDQSNVRVELLQRARSLNKEFDTQGGAISHADAVELLQLLRQYTAKDISDSQNTVTKQQLQQEIQALRRLIESKGK
jgi:hypothetical protein